MTQSLPFPLVTVDDHDVIRRAMEELELWESGETIEDVQRAGEGNMNSVVRVTSDRRRIILKQSRPWVEKYPQIAAPVERIFAEIDFYSRVAGNRVVSDSMPTMLGSSEELYLMAMEDLGSAGDYSDLYSSRLVDAIPLEQSLTWLAELHSIPVDPVQREGVGNRALRELNHAHIYTIPLQTPAAIDLDSICDGLERLAAETRDDPTIRLKSSELGEVYLGTGEYLLHGDFYPGSWLCADGEFRVIDPEFCFAGPVEFDLGVLAAHRVLIGGDEASIAVVGDTYKRLGGANFELGLLRGFAALEIIRRLIGVAQLPLRASLKERAEMIRIARAWLERN
jgi:5-methylthioribose kinase